MNPVILYLPHHLCGIQGEPQEVGEWTRSQEKPPKGKLLRACTKLILLSVSGYCYMAEEALELMSSLVNRSKGGSPGDGSQYFHHLGCMGWGRSSKPLLRCTCYCLILVQQAIKLHYLFPPALLPQLTS